MDQHPQQPSEQATDGDAGLSRRTFMAASAGAAAVGVSAVGAVAGASQAAATTPAAKAGQAAGTAEATHHAPKLTRTIKDAKHIVVLMQENRSFDHYYGTLRGVRGFGDRATIELAGGYSVFDLSLIHI